MDTSAESMRFAYEKIQKLFSRNHIMVLRHTTKLRCSPLVLVGFIFCALFMQNGYCDNRKSSNSQKHSHSSSAAIYRPPQSPIKWNNWTSSSSSSRSTISDAPSHWNEAPANVVPLTLEEYQKRVTNNNNSNFKKVTTVKSSVSTGGTLPNQSAAVKPSASKKSPVFEEIDNHVKIEIEREEKDKAFNPDTAIDMDFIRSKALSFGKLVIDHFTSGGGIGTMDTSRQMRSIFLDPNLNRQDSPADSETKSRGVVDWLARLIGVQGKTLGEFLREYQVHVLYDLVFTFFKWIFFLYAGLLIP